MASATGQPPKSRRRWFAPRFSLAAALVAMTLCAVGLWYWYRVPFEVEHQIDKQRSEVETVRRTWGGTVRHGPRRVYLSDKLYLLESYRDGIPHGQWEWRDSAGHVTISAEFRFGRLESFQASPECDQRLARHLAEGTIDPRVAHELLKDNKWEFIETPLKDALQILQDTHLIPIECYGVARARGPSPPASDRPSISIDMPITCNGVDRPLIVVLGKMLQPHGLVCDYRYGSLWVTERADAENWKDPTGVSEIVPPAGSRLAAQWEAASRMEFVETPLADAFRIVENTNLVKFDTSPAPDSIVHSSRITVTLNVSGLPLKHCLGMLLDRVDCQAKLDGETIVIDLQPDHPEAKYR